MQFSQYIRPIANSFANGIIRISEHCFRVVEEIIPIALPVMGAIVVVAIGIKVFKKVSGR